MLGLKSNGPLRKKKKVGTITGAPAQVYNLQPVTRRRMQTLGRYNLGYSGGIIRPGEKNIS